MAKSISIFLFLCIACQSGKIPCPEPKTAKLHRNSIHRISPHNVTMFASNTPDEKSAQSIHDKTSKPGSERSVKSVTVEEWDCPHPGEKKYMPRSVKENIRKNMRKINADKKKDVADSLSLK